MNQDVSFGTIIKEHRRVGCAIITIRKIEADTLRPSVQIAERLGPFPWKNGPALSGWPAPSRWPTSRPRRCSQRRSH